jgi:crotonobetainyl-CoA:carnitine CoA-transferase CaiB-like acyl-CoA transferase
MSIGDSLAALHGVIGALMALHHRKVNGGRGQVVDVALYEAVFNMMESTLPEYDAFGVVRERTGTNLPGIVPSNTYPTARRQVRGHRRQRRLDLQAADVRDRPRRPRRRSRARHNAGRVARAQELDEGDRRRGPRAHPLEQVPGVLEKAEVPSGRIYSAPTSIADLQYLARGMIERPSCPTARRSRCPGIVPKLSARRARRAGSGPELGEHTDEVLAELGYDAARGLGLGDVRLRQLRLHHGGGHRAVQRLFRRCRRGRRAVGDAGLDGGAGGVLSGHPHHRAGSRRVCRPPCRQETPAGAVDAGCVLFTALLYFAQADTLSGWRWPA